MRLKPRCAASYKIIFSTLVKLFLVISEKKTFILAENCPRKIKSYSTVAFFKFFIGCTVIVQ